MTTTIKEQDISKSRFIEQCSEVLSIISYL
jgi:hypothetical protein